MVMSLEIATLPSPWIRGKREAALTSEKQVGKMIVAPFAGARAQHSQKIRFIGREWHGVNQAVEAAGLHSTKLLAAA
ncbi:hypothetical protein N7E02_03755 (plasmid) [Aliirhizobium terrae]|nr:hypothetical protein [Rhizobium sp. CC-CFT758]WJH38535.1 hypothetical protein N7E02_03755 [Rhizobium sp. CC-CFT758]